MEFRRVLFRSPARHADGRGDGRAGRRADRGGAAAPGFGRSDCGGGAEAVARLCARVARRGAEARIDRRRDRLPRARCRRRLCPRTRRRRLCGPERRGCRRHEGAGRDRRLCAADECGGGGDAVKLSASLFAVAAVLWGQPACAQEADPAAALGKTLAGAIYTPADFTRYAPKTALDMLNQVPGFSIPENTTVRRLGQATGTGIGRTSRRATLCKAGEIS